MPQRKDEPAALAQTYKTRLHVGPGAAEFVRSRYWIEISGGDLPFPVVMSIGKASGGVMRCTGMILGISGEQMHGPVTELEPGLSAEQFQEQLASLRAEAAAPAPEVIEIMTSSLHKIKVSDLLERVLRIHLEGTGALEDEGIHGLADELVAPHLAAASDLERAGYDLAEWQDGIINTTGEGEALYRMPPLMEFTKLDAQGRLIAHHGGPTRADPADEAKRDEQTPILEWLYPGFTPDLPEGGLPRTRSKQYNDEFYRQIASYYEVACERHPDAPTQELCRMLGKIMRRDEWQIAPGRWLAPEATVRRWVNIARQKGYLGPSRPGKAGHYPEDADAPRGPAEGV
jgi:hypothetical protein